MQAEDFVVPATIHRLEHQDHRDQDSRREKPVRDAFDLDSSALETTDVLENFDFDEYLSRVDAYEQPLQDANQSGLALDPLKVRSNDSADPEISQMQGSYNQSSKQIIPDSHHARQDYEMRLMLLEQQNKKREHLMMEPYSQLSEQTVPNSRHALQDHQMQLMLLEQQNKKRLIEARRAHDQEGSAALINDTTS